MRRFTLLLLVSLSCASASFAGVTYDFKIVSEGAGGRSMSGKAAVSGQNMRLDFAQGDGIIFGNNSVVISTDGGDTLVIIDSEEKTYYEMDVQEIFSSLGALVNASAGLVRFNVRNQKVDVTNAGAGGSIEGYPTTRYVIDASYEMEVKVMGFKNQSSIKSRTESWVTPKLGDVSPTFIQQRNFKTGIQDLDELIEAHAETLKGFALKNITTTTTTDKGGKQSTSTSTMTISNIKQAAVAESQFKIPAGYDEVDAPTIAGARD